ncbi:hypothetical protein BKA70DRAFT_1242183 [Coprinopsis sp. MPI-PUGE-AT-0042]|nr:hypothetical protein BKA70DRAFT_1242183 [Coprinopsis sp. MPI-PUGE-AT-0042]
MASLLEPPRATRSATQAGLASLFSFSALTANLPPSFSISNLLRRAVELDHDAHHEVEDADSEPANVRKRGADPAASCSSSATASESEPPAPSAPGEGRKKTKKNKSRKHTKDQADREEAFREHGHQARPSAYKEHVSSAEQIATKVEFDLNSLPATSCGYQAKPQNSSEAVVLSLEALIAEGYTVEAWDGRTNKVFVDPVTSKIFAACVGRPSDGGFNQAVEDAFEAMERMRNAFGFDLGHWLHRRGQFPAFNIGISYGQGPKEPTNLDTGKYSAALQELLDHSAIIRLAHYASVQALGRFDSTKGGHLVLPDLKVVIEFPAGSLILIPSATLTHANTPVQDGEVRLSFTQFSAGGLFRYVDNGFWTETALLIQDKDAYWQAIEDKKLRWKRGLRLWSTMEELVSGTRRAFEDPLEDEE